MSNKVKRLKAVLSKHKIKIDKEDIKKLKNAVKNNFEKINEVTDILKKYPFLENDIKNRIKKGDLIQPGRIVETVIIQFISDYLGCSYVGEGIYNSNRYIMTQNGGSGKSDLTILDKYHGELTVYEIKEPSAYGLSSGFTYDDDGIRELFTTENEEFLKKLTYLFKKYKKLKNYNILDNIGHNISFEISNTDIISNKFDFMISYNNKGSLMIMSNDEYKDKFKFVIEVRSSGRNSRTVFTKKLLNLDKDDTIVFLDKDKLSEIIPRGGKISHRYKYKKNGANFSFDKKDVKKKDGKLFINVGNIKQHVGEVSIKHSIKKKPAEVDNK